MSSVSAPFGLRPAYSPSGIIRPTAYSIVSGYASNILANSPVRIGANGTLEAAVAGDALGFIGTFQGVEWTDLDGRRRVSNKWTANQPAAATDPIVAYATLDPSIVYEIQSDGVAPNLTVADIGAQFNMTVESGSAITGLSNVMLSTASKSTTANLQLRLVGIALGPDNNVGDQFLVVQVQVSNHQNVATRVAY